MYLATSNNPSPGTTQADDVEAKHIPLLSIEFENPYLFWNCNDPDGTDDELN